MAVATRVLRYLKQRGADFKVINHPRLLSLESAAAYLNLNFCQVARISMIEDGENRMVAIYPMSHYLDLDAVEVLSGHRFELVPENNIDRIFDDCDPGSHPALAQAYGFSSIIDESLLQAESVYVESGCHCALIELTGDEFRFLHRKPLIGSIAKSKYGDDPCQGNKRIDNACSSTPDCLGAVYSLPEKPESLTSLFDLDPKDPQAAAGLSQLISASQGLFESLHGYCRPPFFKSSLTEDISFEHWLTLLDSPAEIARLRALVVAINVLGRFEVSNEGPLSYRQVWRHSLLRACLMERLLPLLPEEQGKQLYAKDLFLAGLLADTGLMVMGHCFPPEFKNLNKLYLSHPGQALECLEHRVLAMGKAKTIFSLGHGEIGAWVLRSWGLTGESVATCAHRADLEYSGQYIMPVLMARLADHMLAMQGEGLDNLDIPVKTYLQSLGLFQPQVSDTVAALLEEVAELSDHTPVMVA